MKETPKEIFDRVAFDILDMNFATGENLSYKNVFELVKLCYSERLRIEMPTEEEIKVQAYDFGEYKGHGPDSASGKYFADCNFKNGVNWLKNKLLKENNL